MDQTQQQQAVNVQDLMENSERIQCDNCSGKFFEPAFVLRKLSKARVALLTQQPVGEDQIIPLQVYRCSDCKAPYAPNQMSADMLNSEE